MKKISTKSTVLSSEIIKRDGSIVPFDLKKIERAIDKAMSAAREFKTGA